MHALNTVNGLQVNVSTVIVKEILLTVLFYTTVL
jgi:hypothetical protein